MNDKLFNDWAKAHKYNTKVEDGVYTNTHTQSAWEAWQASKSNLLTDYSEFFEKAKKVAKELDSKTYIAPQTKPLSDEKLKEIAAKFFDSKYYHYEGLAVLFARAIEERHGIK